MIVKLRTPVKDLDGSAVEAVTLREQIKAGDVMFMQRLPESAGDFERDCALVARLCGVEPNVVADMGIADASDLIGKVSELWKAAMGEDPKGETS